MAIPFSYMIALPCLVVVFIVVPSWFGLFDGNGGNRENETRDLLGPKSSSPANLSDSAFPPSRYVTLIKEPFRSYPCMPKRIHISQKNNVHESTNQTGEWVVDMTISFSLDYSKCQNATPKLYYRQGFHPEKAVVPQDEPLQFNYTSTINGTAFFQSDWIYHLKIPNIKAGSHRYWYRMEVHDKNYLIGEASVSETGQQMQLLRGSSRSLLGKTPSTKAYSFLTPPSPHTPTAVALVGDLGQTKNSTKTMAHILHDSISNENKNPTTLLLIAGDMAYADSDPTRWISWFDLMEPLTRTLTMHVAAGNHEIECDNSTLDVFKQYEHYFHNPNRIAEADLLPITNEYRQSLWEGSCSTPSQFQGHYNFGNAFYSFQHGYIHFIILSSYSDSRRGSPQYEWLYKELEFNVNRTTTPWLIVSFHSPLYTTFVGHVNESQAMQMKASMEPLFHRYNVNLVICGHDHGYMRTHSLQPNGTVDATGKSPIYLTLGAGGNREQHSKGYQNKTGPEEWVAKRDLRDFGYGNLVVTNASHAMLTWVRDHVPGTDDDSDDKNVWIVNRHYHVPNSTNNDTLYYEADESNDWMVTEESISAYR